MSGVSWRRFARQRGAMAGLLPLGLVIALSVAAPLIAPQDPSDPLGFDPLAANHPPALSWLYLCGADMRGRSVLALLLWGGRATLAIGIGAALAAALMGVALGALAGWRGGAIDAALARAMELCQVAPPLLVVLMLFSRLGGVSAPLMLLVFAATGWVAAARLSRAAVAVARAAPYVEAARAAGVSEPRLLVVHALPAALAPVAAWTAGAAATYVALEASLDFLGLGLPPGTTSWGTALTGAQDALAVGNWWWMACGGLAMALSTLALGAVARGIGAALDPAAVPSRPAVAPDSLAESADDTDAEVPDAWRAWQPESRPRPAWTLPRIALPALALALLGGSALAAGARGGKGHRPPEAHALLVQAESYPSHTQQRFAYIATANYAATESALRGQSVPWAAWGACPQGLRATRCAQSDVQLWFGGAAARVEAEGSIFICTPHVTWSMNPMAGLAQTTQRGCGPLGPTMGGLGTTAGVVGALLPELQGSEIHSIGRDVVAGRRCWIVALPEARACIDAETGLDLRLERLDRAGLAVAAFRMTAISYGLDLAPQIFGNPIPGGHGPLVDGLTQPLLDIQEADDLALFTTLVPTTIPRGLTAQTPTFDSFYDDARGYALTQRVRQAYQDSKGRIALVLIETLPGSAWDATPPRAHSQAITLSGRRLQVWLRTSTHPATARVESEGTAAIVTSNVLSPRVLERVANGLR